MVTRSFSSWPSEPIRCCATFPVPHSQAIEQVLALILATLALAGEPVDFTPRLPEGRILSWTHLVNATESSHWGSSEVRAVVLTHLEVERGGRLGEQQLEWVHRVEGVAAELDIGAHTVARWRDDQPSVEAHALQRFEQLSTSIWRTIVSPDGAMEWFQIMRGDGHWDEQVTGPRPPEVLAWAMGLQLGGAAWLTGQTRSREVDLTEWD